MLLEKTIQRKAAYRARDQQDNQDVASLQICRRILQLPAYQTAATVMWYVGCKSEVLTLLTIRQELNTGKRIVIPYCARNVNGDRQLGLWRLTTLDELEPGTWNIPEPPTARRGEAGTEALPGELDVIVIPGVAFDRTGGRLGNGAGYYDRLLANVRRDALLLGVCFESQIINRVATETHDIGMNLVITEKNVYQCNER